MALFSVEPRETIKACKGSQYFYAGEDANKQQTVASYFFSRWKIGDFRACSRTHEAFVVAMARDFCAVDNKAINFREHWG